ncbi:[acyl-carrier-protein] S-malonyltransferase [Photobacterium gaetbulicola]|uniref:Malonyl CoA-acyl carrier protein transacylase n=1 Tax=Photobacterium gaetbulicola Gung47 TaxID=658445 RepID=A0A0C5WHN8_9GAMM|nr:ACP S-malonyltransferase [Photobacterium gaetbulicola]AJR05687.1 hypothetical protein H744_1c0662 [Photobacterium gaetbulicola Gung47]PSU14661.1 [acyl-carrier-protein] S-malonyltransferase [Photobacterium gaetbulicola]
MTVYMFPGQGSQYKGMGKDLFDKYPEFLDKADSFLGYSVRDLCLDDIGDKLNNTQYTQPALFVVSALSYLNEVELTGVIPDYVIGHSVGEYSALFASGLLDFETAIRLVIKRGQLMSKAENGAMAAIIGLNKDKVNKILKQNKINSVWVANDNSSLQVVISGEQQIVPELSSLFLNNGATYFVPLKVSGAFHSPLMKTAKDEFTHALDEARLNSICIPAISNVNARPYAKQRVKLLLSEQITGQVRWLESIEYLLSIGEFEFKELGPGSVLTKLVNNIKNEYKVSACQ